MKASIYDNVNNRLTRQQNSGFDYEGQIFARSLSSYILSDPNRSNILTKYEEMIYFLVQKVKTIKTFFNYTVPKDYTQIN